MAEEAGRYRREGAAGPGLTGRGRLSTAPAAPVKGAVIRGICMRHPQAGGQAGRRQAGRPGRNYLAGR